MRPYSRIAFAIILALAAVFALEPRGSAASAQTLTPAPLPNATCQTTGGGIFCHGDFTFSLTNADTGIFCGTFEVLQTGTGTDTFEERYNAAGRLLTETVHVNLPGTFINSVTGATINAINHHTVTFDLSTPGDMSTAIRTFTGAVTILIAPHVGVVSQDVGKVVLGPSGSGTIPFEGGPHDSLDNYPGYVQAVCAALS